MKIAAQIWTKGKAPLTRNQDRYIFIVEVVNNPISNWAFPECHTHICIQ